MEKIKRAWYPEDQDMKEGRIELFHANDVDLSGFKGNQIIMLKDSGILMGISLWLDNHYDWMLVKDNHGEICLLPRRKA